MIVSFIHRAVMQGIPLLFGATGEIITEKSGNLNLGIPCPTRAWRIRFWRS